MMTHNTDGKPESWNVKQEEYEISRTIQHVQSSNQAVSAKMIASLFNVMLNWKRITLHDDRYKKPCDFL